MDGVRLLDFGADVTVAQALAYFEARLHGLGIRDAMEEAGVWKKSWFGRWSEHRTRK